MQGLTRDSAIYQQSPTKAAAALKHGLLSGAQIKPEIALVAYGTKPLSPAPGDCRLDRRPDVRSTQAEAMDEKREALRRL
jgi:hypothetical protein